MQGLVVEELAVRFGPRWALAHVGLQVPDGGSLLLLGHNGSGKTTLLRCLATAIPYDHGRITLDGIDLWAGREALRPRIAMFGHATRLWDDLSARDNLATWAGLFGLRDDLDARLARVGLADTGDRPARTFSAGMKRRLALAVVLLKRPRLALFDEPFTNLDADGRALVSTVIDEVRAQGALTVVCTHLPDLGARHCDDALVLDDGQVAWRGPALDAPRGSLP
jgi:heme exporter protein A